MALVIGNKYRIKCNLNRIGLEATPDSANRYNHSKYHSAIYLANNHIREKYNFEIYRFFPEHLSLAILRTII